MRYLSPLPLHSLPRLHSTKVHQLRALASLLEQASILTHFYVHATQIIVTFSGAATIFTFDHRAIMVEGLEIDP